MNTEIIANSDEDFYDEKPGQVVKIFTTDKKVTKYDIYLDDSFDTPSADYRELFHTLQEAKSLDIVNIHLASYGGSCHVGFQVCHAVKECRANTIITVEQPCYSMGAILACCGKNLVMRPATLLMFHNYSGGNRGKGGEMMLGAKQQDKWLHDSFKYFAHPFLTEDELLKLKLDQDIYVHESDRSLKKRIKKHFGWKPVI